MKYATIVLDRSVNKPLDYSIPHHLEVEPGSRVLVPIRSKTAKGTVLSVQKTSEVEKVSAILDLLESEKAVPKELFSLAHWMSDYYICPMRKAIMSILPASLRKGLTKKKQKMIVSNLSNPRLIEYCSSIRSKKPIQAKVLDVLLKYPKGILLTELLELSQVSQSPVNTLIKLQILKEKDVEIDRSLLEDDEFIKTKPKTLNPEQQQALDQINHSVVNDLFTSHLLYGVTGSGKTEVYMQALDKALSLNKGVIMLVPEIALTAQTIERLKARFSERIAILHHRLSDGERFDAWHAIRKGEISIVVGARSAIFSPVKNLGLVIVDEEQDTSYKQMDDMPCYHARDVAIMRAKLSNATIVLGSATPSLESFHNAKRGKYNLLTLRARANEAKRPEISIINMKDELDKSKGFTLFSSSLLDKIKKRLELGEQILLFLNRRGYFCAQVCTNCSEPIKCNHCDVSLTYHKHENILSCHLCGFTIRAEKAECAKCKSPETMKFKGPGTEMVERSLHAIFPEIRTLRMDRDTTKHKGSHDRLFKEFRAGKADVLIGTQMIAKGLHFPAVTLVGILNADSSLHIPDFRSQETVFQLITQVAGRSGRGELPGEVILQSYLYDHPLIKLAAKEDYEPFFDQEIQTRELFDYPPFSQLIKIVFSGRNEERTYKFATNYVQTLLPHLPANYTINPIVPCGYARIKDRFRFQFLIKGKRSKRLAEILHHIEKNVKKPWDLRILIDVDPLSTFS